MQKLTLKKASRKQQHTHTLHHTLTDDSPLSGEARLAVINAQNHHLKNGSAPPTNKRLIKSLATVTKPASLSFNTQALIEGKVKNWEFTTMLILRDHYTEVIAELVRLTHSLSTHDWQEPFQVAPSLASGQAPPGRESGANRSPDFCQTGGWQNSHSPPLTTTTTREGCHTSTTKST